MKSYEPLAQTALLREFLDARNRARPFFAVLSWGPPHPPYRQIPEGLRIFGPGEMRPRPNMQDPNTEFLADFYSHIAALDTELGHILRVLEPVAEDMIASGDTCDPANEGHPKTGQRNCSHGCDGGTSGTRLICWNFRRFPSPVSKV